MVKIYFTRQAHQELKKIKEYIAINSPVNAIRVVQNILDGIKILSSTPEKGRHVIKISENIIGQILVYKYRIFHRQVERGIEVLSIYHCSRLLENNPGLQQFFND